MGQISDKLIKRPSKGRKLADEIRREAGSIRDALDSLDRGATARRSRWGDLDPLHAAYVAVQNLTSILAGRVSQFSEFEPYYQAALYADDSVRPGWAFGGPYAH